MFLESIPIDFALEFGITLFKERKKFQQLIDQYLKQNKHILIFGTGGAGKSTLGKIVGGENISIQYRQTYEVETKVIGNKKIIVAPGQQRTQRLGGEGKLRQLILDNIVNTEKATLIIYLVSYGYASIGRVTETDQPSPEDFQAYQDFLQMNPNGLLSDFIKYHTQKERENEIKYFNEWLLQPLTYYKDGKGKVLNLITLVNKQDLWWDDKIAVEKHYTEGTYNDLIAKIQGHRGNAAFRHLYLSTSTVINNFRLGSETLQPHCIDYDETRKFQHLTHFLSELTKMMKNAQ